MATDYGEKERAFIDGLKENTGRDLGRVDGRHRGAGLAHRNDIIDWLRQQGASCSPRRRGSSASTTTAASRSTPTPLSGKPRPRRPRDATVSRPRYRLRRRTAPAAPPPRAGAGSRYPGNGGTRRRRARRSARQSQGLPAAGAARDRADQKRAPGRQLRCRAKLPSPSPTRTSSPLLGIGAKELRLHLALGDASPSTRWCRRAQRAAALASRMRSPT